MRDSQCGCDDDDDDLYIPPVSSGVVTVSPLPDSPCTPDGAVTGESDAVFAGEIDPDECVDWALPIRPGQPPIPPSEEPGTRPKPPTLFLSQPVTWSGQKDDCQSGYRGLPYSYSLPAGWATSLISQADATKKASQWLEQNGPVLARQYGTCEKITGKAFLSLSFVGGSGCATGVFSLEFGDLLGNKITGCPTAVPVGQLKSLEFTGATGCPLPTSNLYSLAFTGITNCN